jgi:NAD(P)-dependent dehydrogenase (short-subunit alcohol dehydrogenase family)
MTSNTLFSLTGKNALITGGGSGIGKAIAHAFSDAGAKIAIVGRREGMLNEALEGRQGTAIATDLMAEEAPQTIFAACHAADIMPDIIVSAAGLNPRKHADDVTPDVWRQTLHLNLSVPFFVAQAFVPHMKQNNWGRIINIASLQSNRAFTNGIAYGASKGGVSQLTRAMAEAWSKDGITTNAIAPGFFPTELTAAVFGDDEVSKHHASMTCIGRNGELADLAGPAIFLASDASNYVTGQIVNVDGGYTAK